VTAVTANAIARGYTYNANGNLAAVTGSTAAYTGVTWWVSNLANRVGKSELPQVGRIALPLTPAQTCSRPPCAWWRARTSRTTSPMWKD
jgi:hypothetical protein